MKIQDYIKMTFSLPDWNYTKSFKRRKFNFFGASYQLSNLLQS
ncbi:hypothetical protein LEP1GSC175_1409 [Leptospira santarosai str. HAI821]|nr:hypothetical protein LEP1GSC175_1409 [Leptospira santarosai str. HAI821]